MAELISVGANFIKVAEDNDYEYTFTFKCKDESIPDDRIIESVKTLVFDFINDGDFNALFELYQMGWYILTIEE